jgi:TonB family protein
MSKRLAAIPPALPKSGKFLPKSERFSCASEPYASGRGVPKLRYLAVFCGVAGALWSIPALGTAHADEAAAPEALPIIVTYELKKMRQEGRAVERNPKGFWMRQIVERIEDKKVDLAKPLREPVVVHVTFVVGRDGRLLSKAVSEPSGNAEADGMALAMLDRAQPFPAMPAAMSEAELTFSMPVRFRGALP